jgi:hypothetical protein
VRAGYPARTNFLFGAFARVLARYSRGMSFWDAVRWGSAALKLLAAVIGVEAARRWHRSTALGLDGAAAATFNRSAANATALSVIVGAVSVLIDAIWVAPALWGP